MGTDIHCIAEYMDGNGVWHATAPYQAPWHSRDAKITVLSDWITTRDYDVFALLANVRNGSGFAGVDTGEAFEPISNERGLPDGLSAAAQRGLTINETWDYGSEEPEGRLWLGDHSFTYVTLAELLAVDWDRRRHRRGIVSWPTYCQWRATGGPERLNNEPESWSGGISGGKILNVTEAEFEMRWDKSSDAERMDARRKSGRGRFMPEDLSDADGISRYAQISWQVTYRRSCLSLMPVIVDLVRRSREHGVLPSEIRLVMGFDS